MSGRRLRLAARARLEHERGRGETRSVPHMQEFSAGLEASDCRHLGGGLSRSRPIKPTDACVPWPCAVPAPCGRPPSPCARGSRGAACGRAAMVDRCASRQVSDEYRVWRLIGGAKGQVNPGLRVAVSSQRGRAQALSHRPGRRLRDRQARARRAAIPRGAPSLSRLDETAARAMPFPPRQSVNAIKATAQSRATMMLPSLMLQAYLPEVGIIPGSGASRLRQECSCHHKRLRGITLAR